MTWDEVMAAKLYAQRVAERGPTWEHLGAVTKLVWIGYVLAGQEPDA